MGATWTKAAESGVHPLLRPWLTPMWMVYDYAEEEGAVRQVERTHNMDELECSCMNEESGLCIMVTGGLVGSWNRNKRCIRFTIDS